MRYCSGSENKMRKFYLVRYEVDAPEDSMATRMLEDKEFKTEKEAYNFYFEKLRKQGISEEEYEESLEDDEPYELIEVIECEEIKVLSGTVRYEGEEGDVIISLKLENGESLGVHINPAHYWLMF